HRLETTARSLDDTVAPVALEKSGGILALRCAFLPLLRFALARRPGAGDLPDPSFDLRPFLQLVCDGRELVLRVGFGTVDRWCDRRKQKDAQERAQAMAHGPSTVSRP